MDKVNKLSEHELLILKDLEASINELQDIPDFKLADNSACKALITLRPVPSLSFTKSLAKQLFSRDNPPSENRVLRFSKRVPGWITWVLSLLLILFFLFGTSVGRGLAQEILNFFEREGESAIPESTIIQSRPQVKNVELEMAADVLNFQLFFPNLIPEGFELESFEIDPKGDYGSLIFSGPASENGVMSPRLVIRQQTTPFLERIGPEAEVISIQVGHNQAEYVEGGWIYVSDDDDSVIPEEKTFHWEKSVVPLQRLRWKAENVFIELSFIGSDTQDGFLDFSNLISIAESLE